LQVGLVDPAGTVYGYISRVALRSVGAAVIALEKLSRDTTTYLKALGGLKGLVELAVKSFGGFSQSLSYIKTRFAGARAILLRLDDRLKGFSAHPREGFKLAVATSSLLEEGWERVVRLRTLDGGVVELRLGTPLDRALYFVEVSKWRLKCTCPDAVFLSSRADRVLSGVEEVSRYVTYLYRYTICKHVLAALAIGVAEGVLSLSDPILRRSLWVASARIVAAVEGVDALRRSGGIEHLAAILRSLHGR